MEKLLSQAFLYLVVVLKLLARFLRRPFYKSPYLAGSFFLAASRLMQTMAFFLPLKALILLSSGGQGQFYGKLESSMNIKIDSLVLLIISLVPLVFCLHIIFGIVSRWLFDLDLRFYKDSGEPIFFEGKKIEGKKLARLHNHCSKSGAEVLIFLSTIAIGSYFDAWLSVGVFLIAACDFFLFYRFSFSVGDEDRVGPLKLHKRQVIEYISSINFMLVFCLLVIQIYLFGMGVYSSVFLLLLFRQTFQALQRFSIENMHIYKFVD